MKYRQAKKLQVWTAAARNAVHAQTLRDVRRMVKENCKRENLDIDYNSNWLGLSWGRGKYQAIVRLRSEVHSVAVHADFYNGTLGVAAHEHD